MRLCPAPQVDPLADAATRRRPSFGGRQWAVVACSLALLAPSAASPAPSGNGVRPGSILRWPGAEIESCELDARRFSPVSGACYYPIDLLRPAGPLELARWSGGNRETVTVQVSASDYPTQKLQLPRHLVELSAEDQARVNQENREIARLWGREGERRFDLPLRSPLEPLPEGGRFGVKRIINGVPRGSHSGADFSAPSGTPVFAAGDGEVALAADHFFGGHSIFLDHGDGLITMYMHLSEVDVATGDRVARGQRIGAVGETGRAQGPHLHYGVRWHGARVDPKGLLNDPQKLFEPRQASAVESEKSAKPRAPSKQRLVPAAGGSSR
jgi:hypothetical protein